MAKLNSAARSRDGFMFMLNLLATVAFVQRYFYYNKFQEDPNNEWMKLIRI